MNAYITLEKRKLTINGQVEMVTLDLLDDADPDTWICPCGNTPSEDGFFPCAADGHPVEPTPDGWTTNCYVCDRCGLIIDQSTRQVVGVSKDPLPTGGEGKQEGGEAHA